MNTDNTAFMNFMKMTHDMIDDANAKQKEEEGNALNMVTIISARGKYGDNGDRDTVFCVNEDEYYIKWNGSITVCTKIIDEGNTSIMPIYKEGERIMFIPERSINFVVRMTLEEFKESHDDIAWDWEYDCLDDEDLKDTEKSDAPVIEPI